MALPCCPELGDFYTPCLSIGVAWGHHGNGCELGEAALCSWRPFAKCAPSSGADKSFVEEGSWLTSQCPARHLIQTVHSSAPLFQL